jgi:hypothetical protein
VRAARPVRAGGLGKRTGGNADTAPQADPTVCLGALSAWLLCLNKALNDMVHAARAASGLDPLPDAAAVSTPQVGWLAAMRGAARFVPFHRMYHSVEMTFVILLAAVADLVVGGLGATRLLTAVLVPLALLSVVGHFVAIVTSRRLRQ